MSLDRDKIMQEALLLYCQEVISGLPLRWQINAIQTIMVKEKQDEPTERIKKLIDYVITLTELQIRNSDTKRIGDKDGN